MRFVMFEDAARAGIALAAGDGAFRGLRMGDDGYPGSLDALVRAGRPALEAAARVLEHGNRVDLDRVRLLPPLQAPGKIICVGLNYVDHSLESGFVVPTYPTIFARFTSSLIPSGAPLISPSVSVQFDYEGELVAVIGKGGRHIAEANALEHVIGYSIFNEASVRDYQTKSPQWTVGKNFDGTGAFGPAMVTADELPPGAAGLRIQTRLNGETVQRATTSDMVFSVARLVSILSEAMTLEAGDVIVTGTPAGVGMARKPQLFLKHGDVCEVEIESIGILTNRVEDEQIKPSRQKAAAE
jgi:2-keto-4-pentenoate hydratase/2-oxohepta-3-ene-1,7-dioic acid hydratase in catechol pathway